jgi:hypothetical protein
MHPAGVPIDELYSARHFSQSNPAGAGQGDLPALLRRVADTLETLGPVEVLDVVHHSEVTADGDWPSLTVYYVPVGRLIPPRPRPPA